MKKSFITSGPGVKRAIPCLVSCLPQRLQHGNVKTFELILKQKMEESKRAIGLALGHSLFLSGQKYNFKP